MIECRFCAKTLSEDENHPTITEEIKENFIKITQIELLQSEICSKFICELCLRSVQLASILKKQLIENEERLYALLERVDEYEEPESPIQYFEPTMSVDETNMNYETSFDPRIGYAVQPAKKIEIESPSNEEVYIKDEKEVDESLIREEPLQLGESISSLQDIVPESQKVTKRPIIKVKNLGTATFTDFQLNRFTTNAQRSSEKVMQKNSRTNKFECIHCTFAAESKNVLKTHILNFHKTEIRNFKCPHCDSTYFKGSNLKRHVLVKHMNHRYHCVVEDCTIHFQDRSSLRRHLLRTHARNLSHDELETLMSKTRKETGPLVNLPQILPPQGDLEEQLPNAFNN